MPGLSKTEFATGLTTSVSSPVDFPVNETPSVSVFVPLPDTVDGEFFASLAVPPVNAKVKSSLSKSPVPSFLLNTGSLKKTCRRSLFSAILTESINAGTISFKFAVLFC